jgi:hypothetical protein
MDWQKFFDPRQAANKRAIILLTFSKVQAEVQNLPFMIFHGIKE